MAIFPTTALINSTLGQIQTGHYLALFTSTPNVSGGGTEVTGYTRLAVTFGTITSGSMASTAELLFNSLPTANISHYAIMSAVTGGTMKAFGPLSSTAAVISGDQIRIPSGGVTVSFSGS
ncbi:MAG TPA: hypothetical protein VL020_07630 [Pseudomonadales bacterium]|nr:hypothetical protein [Pseudomonadales bacterium]